MQHEGPRYETARRARSGPGEAPSRPGDGMSARHVPKRHLLSFIELRDNGGYTPRHSREGGNPESFDRTTLGPRGRGDDEFSAFHVTQLCKAQIIRMRSKSNVNVTASRWTRVRTCTRRVSLCRFPFTMESRDSQNAASHISRACRLQLCRQRFARIAPMRDLPLCDSRDTRPSAHARLAIDRLAATRRARFAPTDPAVPAP